MKILVVDDDSAIRFLLLTVFGDKHEVSLLCDGHNAISVLSDPNHGFDYVILDWKMPRLTGEKVLEFLSDWSNIRTKFILISGYKLEADSMRYPKPDGLPREAIQREGSCRPCGKRRLRAPAGSGAGDRQVSIHATFLGRGGLPPLFLPALVAGIFLFLGCARRFR